MNIKKVTQPNLLVNATYHLTTAQKQIMLFALSQVDTLSDQPHEDWITIDLQQLHADVGATVPKSTFYLKMHRAIKTLHSKQALMPGTKNHYVSWIHERDQSISGSSIQLKLAPRMARMMVEQKGNFTQIEYKSALMLQNFYSVRIYELLRLWSNIKNIIEISADELRTKLKTLDKYPKSADFRLKILNPAIDQINLYTDIGVKLTQRKSGTKITHYIFTITERRTEYTPKKHRSKLKMQQQQNSERRDYAVRSQ